VRQVPAGIGRQRVRKRYLTALREELAKLGWIEGRNLRIDLRVTGGDADRTRAYAIELVGLAPDVIVASSRPTATAVQERTKTIPIVFTAGGDPATTGVVKNITHPEGNTTGFASTVDSLTGKWLELLKEAAPHITRVALVFNPQAVNAPYFRPVEAAAPMTRRADAQDPCTRSSGNGACDRCIRGRAERGLLAVPVLPSDSCQVRVSPR
jgi:putative ABC transport system substrate-binding protein